MPSKHLTVLNPPKGQAKVHFPENKNVIPLEDTTRLRILSRNHCFFILQSLDEDRSKTHQVNDSGPAGGCTSWPPTAIMIFSIEWWLFLSENNCGGLRLPMAIEDAVKTSTGKKLQII